MRWFFLQEMAQGVWDIPFPAGIWLIKAGNIWHELEELSLSQTSKVELSASANCFGADTRERLGRQEGSQLCCYQSPGPAGLASVAQKAEKPAKASRAGIFGFWLLSPVRTKEAGEASSLLVPLLNLGWRRCILFNMYIFSNVSDIFLSWCKFL